MTDVTRWWLVRHAPVVGHEGVIYGNGEVDCDTSQRARFVHLAATLPQGAVWLTSHLKRTHETARAIRAAGLDGPEPLVEADLGEQFFGDWQWRTWDDLYAASGPEYEAFWSRPGHNAPPNGESFAQVVDRVGAALARLNGRYGGRDIIAVVHGGTIRAALAHALDIAPEKALGVKISTLSVTRLDFVAGGTLNGHGAAWRIGGVNLPA